LHNDAKHGFVEAAADEITKRDGRATDAKISVLTGIPRAEVAKIRAKATKPKKTEATQRAERVMHGWFTDPRYVDAQGIPKQLPLKGHTSFESLTRAYSGDIPYRAMLDEILAGGMAQELENGTFKAVRRHYSGSADTIERIQDFADDLTILRSGFTTQKATGEPRKRRLTVDFKTDIPPAVLRNVDIRIERFLDAISDYLHKATELTTENPGQTIGAKFNLLIAQSEQTASKEPSPETSYEAEKIG